MKKLTILIAAALLAAAPAAAELKYVAVVETELDASAAADLSAAEVRQITAELRREAVENLPVGKYNIMTSETVQSMGGSVLEECAEENCVVALGSKIGADYIVRGVISKFKTNLTLSIEIYETNDGTLVASSDPIRSENAEELLKNARTVCAAMYRKFVESRKAAKKPTGYAQELLRQKFSFWTGLSVDVAGAGLLAFGFYQESKVKSYLKDETYLDGNEHKKAENASQNRNLGYIIGSVFLLTGVSIQILF